MSALRKLEPSDFHFSYYSLAHADGGVCIDMSDGQVRFDWAYVPFGEVPGIFATFARRLHFRSGHHLAADEGPPAPAALGLMSLHATRVRISGAPPPTCLPETE